MEKRRQLIKWLILLIHMLMLVSGWFYEEPSITRRTILLVISLVLMVVVSLIIFTEFKKPKYGLAMALVYLLLVSGMEYYSKYAIDYFYHSLYILIMIYVLVYYPKRQGLLLGLAATAISFIKFIELLSVQPNIGNVSIFVFYGVIQILVLIIAVIARNYFEESQKTKEIYLQLLDTYKQLEDSTKEIERLSMEKERTKIARDLHDTLGHDLTGLIMQIEMGTRLIEKSQYDKGLALLETAKSSSRDSLTRVRQIVQALKTGEAEKRSIESVEALCKTFSEKTGSQITLHIEGKHSITPEVGIAIFRLVQESLTNAVRHGKAKVVRVSIDFKPTEVCLVIEDDGQGCSKIIEGNGIGGMRSRIEHLNGRIGVSSKKGMGFTIEACLPYYDEEGVRDDQNSNN